MPRNKTILQNQFPYHITGRCINKEWFKLSMDQVWKVFCNELYMAHIVHSLQIHSFVLMSNHYHLIASTPNSNLSDCMMQFSKRVSFRLTRMDNRINQTFAGRYFKSILHQPNYYLNAYKYNYRNPVEAGLCKNVQDYPYSTLKSILGGSRLNIPILNDDTLFADIDATLRWLNTRPNQEKTEAVRCALKRPLFQAPKDKSKRLILPPDELL